MQADVRQIKQPIEIKRAKPDWRTSKMGYQFDANDDLWQLDGSITINLGRMRDINEITQEGLRKTLCRYAEELSAGSTASIFTYFNMYCDQSREKSVNLEGLSKWRASLTNETEYRLGALKAFLLAWNEWGYPGVDNEVAQYLEEQTLKGIVKGKVTFPRFFVFQEVDFMLPVFPATVH